MGGALLHGAGATTRAGCAAAAWGGRRGGVPQWGVWRRLTFLCARSFTGLLPKAILDTNRLYIHLLTVVNRFSRGARRRPAVACGTGPRPNRLSQPTPAAFSLWVSAFSFLSSFGLWDSGFGASEPRSHEPGRPSRSPRRWIHLPSSIRHPRPAARAPAAIARPAARNCRSTNTPARLSDVVSRLFREGQGR